MSKMNEKEHDYKFEMGQHYDSEPDFASEKIAVLLNALLNSRDFHWMRLWISFIIHWFIS